ncbi:hypothetical protein ABEB36_000682 [Hypothenemus hampei]|uniref:HTH psq-type domain-containing protein n=1 Tax=Hypothenemus hampei TaxID=57062 RepID=A0ABD1FC45_HYPHA
MSRYVRKTDHGITNFNALVAAIKDVKLANKSIRSTAKSYNIPKSSLARYIQKASVEIEDISAVDDDELLKLVKRVASYATPFMVFSHEQEEALVAYIKRCCDHYYGLSISDLRLLVYQFAKKLMFSIPQAGKKIKLLAETGIILL